MTLIKLANNQNGANDYQGKPPMIYWISSIVLEIPQLHRGSEALPEQKFCQSIALNAQCARYPCGPTFH